jgi:signal peptidase II
MLMRWRGQRPQATDAERGSAAERPRGAAAAAPHAADADTQGGTAAEAPPAAGSALAAARAWLLALLVFACVVILDQLSKSAIEHSITPGEESAVFPGLQFVNTRNHGVAFGFLPGSHLAVTLLIAAALLVLLVYFALHARTPLIWLPVGMLVGGALGNVLDRLRHGAVTDFIKLPLGWPPFNLADASITVGIVVLFGVIERARRRTQ